MYVQQDPSRKNGSETNMSKQGKASRAVVLIPANYELRTAGNRFDPVHWMQQNRFLKQKTAESPARFNKLDTRI